MIFLLEFCASILLKPSSEVDYREKVCFLSKRLSVVQEQEMKQPKFHTETYRDSTKHPMIKNQDFKKIGHDPAVNRINP